MLTSLHSKKQNQCFGGGNIFMSNERSRYQRRTKKKKTNVILNSLIGVVLLLIIIVSASIFLGDNDEETPEQDVKASESQDKTAEEEEETEVVEEETVEEEAENAPESESETEEQASATPDSTEEEDADETDSEPVVTEGGTDSNVIKTIVNPSWKPIGTVQTGEHYNQYDGVDWDEMVESIAYATGIPKDSMTVHFLGNNGHNKSVGTVYTKGKTEIYRVYIEWVDGQGWKPSKVEELSAIPEKKKKEENGDE